MDIDYIINYGLYKNLLPEKYIHERLNSINWYQATESFELSELLITEYQYQFGEKEWDNISSHQKLSLEFVVKFKDKIDWRSLLRNRKINKVDEILELSLEFLDIREICKLTDYIPESFFNENIEKIPSHNFSFIYQKLKLDESFIRKNISFLDMQLISASQELNENFIADFEHIVNWEMISRHQILSEDFIRKYKNKVHWDEISQYQKLSESFIREFKNKLYWYSITKNQSLTEDFIIEFEKKIIWSNVYAHQKLSNSFIEKYKQKYVYL